MIMRAGDVETFLDRLESLSVERWLEIGALFHSERSAHPELQGGDESALRRWLAHDDVRTIACYRFARFREALTREQRDHLDRAVAVAESLAMALCEADALPVRNLHGKSADLYAIFTA